MAGQLRPGALRAEQGDPGALSGHRVPGNRPVSRRGGIHEDARHARLVAAVPSGLAAPIRSQAMTYAVERAFAGRRVLVTGGAGFVGGALVHRLVEQGARVTVLDDLFTGRAETLPTSVQFVEGSVTDAPLVR